MNKKATIIIAVLIAAAAVGYGTYLLVFQTPANTNPPEPVVCTQDVFLCPDGSYVSRTGPQCVFTACPNQPFFIGTLRQDANGFSLLIGSPDAGGQEVSYAMPLTIKDTASAQLLAGKNVQIYGTFADGGNLSVDRIQSLSGDASDPTLGNVAVEKTTFINGVKITLNKIVQDSRCPADVNCIQAGWVTANVTLQSDTDKETVDIASNKPAVAFDSYHVSIETVQPLRSPSSAPDPASYIITFRVRSN